MGQCEPYTQLQLKRPKENANKEMQLDGDIEKNRITEVVDRMLESNKWASKSVDTLT